MLAYKAGRGSFDSVLHTAGVLYDGTLEKEAYDKASSAALMLRDRLSNLGTAFLEDCLSLQVPVAVFSIAPQIALESLLTDFGGIECFGTSAVVENHRLTRHLKEPLPYGEGRLALGRSFADTHQFSLQDSAYYGNSSGAVPLLHAVGYPICVNASARLTKIAQGMGWRLIGI